MKPRPRHIDRIRLVAAGGLLVLAMQTCADPMIFTFREPVLASAELEQTTRPPEPGGERFEIDAQVDQAYESVARGRRQEALALFQKILKTDPTNKRARFGLATILMLEERCREARVLFEELIAEEPENFSVKNNLAWLLATSRDHSVRDGTRALELAQQALLLAPENYHVWSTLAESYYVLGQYVRALRASRIALQLAEQQAGTESNRMEYRQQYEKCRRAAEAVSILE